MSRERLSKILGTFLGILGIGIIFYIIWPIVYYETRARYEFVDYLSPVPEVKPGTLAATYDYTNPDNWFETDGLVKKQRSGSGIKYYTISIPKLKIKDATVSIGGEDLSKSLIQFPGTAMPGRVGNAVIFGHSILPQFYNPRDYLAIFSTLPTLEICSEVEVFYDGIYYKYVVEDMFEVKPSNIEILAQNSSGSYLTLVTCTPPGNPFRPKRLIVRAKMVPYEDSWY